MNTCPYNYKCKYKETFVNKILPMLILDPKTGDIEDANIAACNYYLYTKEQLISMNIADINILDKEVILEEMKGVKTRGNKAIRHKHKLSNMEIRDVEIYSSSIEIDDKVLLASIVHDFQLEVELEKDYVRRKVYFDSLFNHSIEAIGIVDKDCKILDINESFKKMFNYDLSEIQNNDITITLCGPESYDRAHKLRESVVNGKFITEEVVRQRKDGSEIDVLLLTFPLEVDKEIIGAYFIYFDISEYKEQEHRISNLVYRDNLTGLLNREAFLEKLESEILKRIYHKNIKEKIAIITLSVNEFKEINDALGHVIANAIIKEFAIRLKNSIRTENAIARLNEDVFAIMIPDFGELNDINILNIRIIENLKKAFIMDVNEFKITTNIGIAIFPDNGLEGISLIRKAEIAMDESKKNSENTPIHFENSFDNAIQEYFKMKRDLFKALEEKELFLNYQPIYDATNNKLVGVEALIRWNHKENGIIPPMKFIPMAEKIGMINSIGEWVLLEACSQNKRLQDLGYDPIYMSVNVSIIQLEKPGFFDIIKRVLKETNLEPKYLQLEITETYFSSNYEIIRDEINEISELGTKFAIDDFGTGYSSLGQLSEININTIKIDRSFVDGVQGNANKAKIVKAIISLADALDIGLIAEGVETEAELSFLKENMCTIIQGFLYSKPVAISNIVELLKKN